MKRVILNLGLLFVVLTVAAQDTYLAEKFVSSKKDTLNYRYIVPENMQEGQQYPLVLFLHGAGERGSDNEKQLTHGGQMFLNPVNREKYPAFVLFPQCPEKAFWAYPARPDSYSPVRMPQLKEQPPIFQAVKELLDTYLENPQVDKKRVYIVGLSMGAMGTYDMISRYPEIFAAAIPICGTVNPAKLNAVKGHDIHVRIFHGDADDVVPVAGSREAYKTLKSLGVDVEYIEFPGCNHGSWNPAFNYPDFMQWLFSQKRD